MQLKTKSELSKWLFWTPLKFAIVSFLLGTLAVGLVSYVLGYILTIQGTQIVLETLVVVAFIYSLVYLYKKLPQTKMTQRAFIELHNSQTILSSALLLITGILLIRYHLSLITKLITLNQTHAFLSLLIISLILIFVLYIMGVLFANFYAKVHRIKMMNIPTWKIILSIPFGFTALWVPGYILPDSSKKSNDGIAQSDWQKSITNWIIKNSKNTAIAFIIITLCTLYIGTKPVLLTFIFALICGIWALQAGIKKFTKNISTRYSTFAVIINIVMIITMFALSVYTTRTSHNVISNTHEVITIQEH